MKTIDDILAKGKKILSEYDSKQFLSQFGIPVTDENLVDNLNEAKKAAQEIGFPVVLKGVSPTITHKTEFNLIELNIKNYVEVEHAYCRIMSNPKVKCDYVLVQKMVYGERELVIGFTRDLQFGPCVMFGLGGIYAEVFRDVSFRLCPLTEQDALDMMGEVKSRKILGNFRGRYPVDKEGLSCILITLGNIGMHYEVIREIDINPLIVQANGAVIAVDALIGLAI